MDFTMNWGWPQWVMVGCLVLKLILFSSLHGGERLETTGERKGLPQRYNAFATFTNAALTIFILVCGGFFR